MQEHFRCGYVGLQWRDDFQEGHVTKTAEIRLTRLFTNHKAELRLHVLKSEEGFTTSALLLAASSCLLHTKPFEAHCYHMYRQFNIQ